MTSPGPLKRYTGVSLLRKRAMTMPRPAFTPVARSKTAALSRVLDSVPKGYHYSTSGACPVGKAQKLARKFHANYGIGCSPAQRMTRKKHGLANALLVMFWPSETATDLDAGLESNWGSEMVTNLATELATNLSSDKLPVASPNEQPEVMPAETVSGLLSGKQVSWLLLATEGAGPIHEEERLRPLLETPRLNWLGYELVRHSSRGRASWTWRRTKQEMADLYALLGEQLNRRQMPAVEQSLVRISRQPGFAGVREQSWELCQFARGRGYAGELPFLFHVQKLSHGVPLRLSPGSATG